MFEGIHAGFSRLRVLIIQPSVSYDLGYSTDWLAWSPERRLSVAP
jgi:hypothetical protein